MKKKLKDYSWVSRFLATPILYIIILIELYMLIPIFVQIWINKVKDQIIINNKDSSDT